MQHLQAIITLQGGYYRIEKMLWQEVFGIYPNDSRSKRMWYYIVVN